MSADAAAADGTNAEEESGPVDVYLPGDRLEDDEELVCDASAYVTQNEFTLDWPCLSFDIIRDALGDQRTTFPMSAYLVAGTQAAAANQNKITVMKVTNITESKQVEEDDDDEDVSICFLLLHGMSHCCFSG